MPSLVTVLALTLLLWILVALPRLVFFPIARSRMWAIRDEISDALLQGEVPEELAVDLIRFAERFIRVSSTSPAFVIRHVVTDRSVPRLPRLQMHPAQEAAIEQRQRTRRKAWDEFEATAPAEHVDQATLLLARLFRQTAVMAHSSSWVSILSWNSIRQSLQARATLHEIRRRTGADAYDKIIEIDRDLPVDIGGQPTAQFV